MALERPAPLALFISTAIVISPPVHHAASLCAKTRELRVQIRLADPSGRAATRPMTARTGLGDDE